ncbi:Protein obstructor-E [Araneus ventricosus]|uniref:Protein obstructor-E n=1 Tax=Araneus ventricosus TaxID=182803 RepID=A0A4Y2MGI0_ARAVE|nr:Protein obstructor-E [Araneus ventricosus]
MYDKHTNSWVSNPESKINSRKYLVDLVLNEVTSKRFHCSLGDRGKQLNQTSFPFALFPPFRNEHPDINRRIIGYFHSISMRGRFSIAVLSFSVSKDDVCLKQTGGDKNVWKQRLAQSRGSSRYSPADEESDGPSTPPQRSPPSRRASVRRRKPTPTPEPSEINKELPDYQLPKREGTTARRVPSRVPAEEFAPHVPDVPVLPDEPILPAVVDELPQITTAAPEDKSQGRRRRPKKRRRPQNGAAKPATNAEKLDVTVPEKSRVPVPVPELLDVDQKRPEPFSVNPERISNPNKFDSPAGLEEKPLWSDDKLVNTDGDSGRRNPEPAPYYPPQVGTNRLPIEDTERIESARELPEPTPPAYPDIPSKRYSLPVDEPSSRASYVPVLTPIRVPTESRSHAPEDFPETRNQESTRRSRPSDRRGPQRATSNRTPSIPIPEVDEERIIPGTRAPQHFLPRDSQPSIPEKALPEVRLPATEPPHLANEFTDKPGFETAEELLERLQEEGNPAVEGIDLQGPDAASRLPNPGDAPYDDAYPPYSENIGSEERSADVVPHRREEDIPAAPRASFNDIQPQETPKRQSTNNVDTDGRQISRYEPPLQRGGFGSRGSERSEITRTTSEDNSRTQIPARGRGSSRYQPEAAPEEFSRTRSTSRSSSDSSSNTPTRTRSSQAPSQAPTRSRNTQRYQPDPAESRARVSTRRQPVDPEYAEERPVDVDYRRRAPAPAHEEDSQYVPPPPQSAPVNVPDEEYIPVRSAARSRPPQHDARDTAEPYLHEELPEDQPDPNAYAPEYQAPRQPSRRRPVDQRGPPPREQPVGQRGPPLREQGEDQRGSPVREQPERQVSRQTSRRENAGHRNAVRQPQPEYRAPEENTRYQAEYQAPPQNSRNQARPVPQRDLNHERQSARGHQSRARQPESSPSQGRASGSSKFTCPEAFGFFADPVQCDKYHECRNGTAVENLCHDGLAFNEVAAPKFLRCDSYRDVDCSSRPELQEAKPTANCPRRYGLYPHETDCTKFFNCVDGAATEVQCPPGLTFNDDRATCDWADLVKSSCKTEDLLGFKCPEPNTHDLVDGVYTTYPHPDNCQMHFFCIKGEDGLRRPRLLTCHEGLVYNPTTKACARPEEVPGCEDFYGSRSPPPKAQRKPAREPVREPIEPEEYEEPPTPKPRRRVQHRRQRN